MKKPIKIILGILYWIGQLTLGILMTAIGLITALVCALFIENTKFHRNGFSFIIEVGDDWGGISLGPVALCGHYYGYSFYDEVRAHEFGHSLQNICWSILFPFVIAIPSAIRYWYKTIMENKGKEFSENWYYSIWFESQATSWGEKVINKIKK